LPSSDVLDLGFAAIATGIAIAISSYLKLGVAGEWLLAMARQILQILVLGIALAVVWQLNNPGGTCGGLAVVLCLGSIWTINRLDNISWQQQVLIVASIGMATAIALTYTIVAIVQPNPWYAPQTVFTIGAIVIGTVANNTAIWLQQLIKSLAYHSEEIETHLHLGASGDRAIASYCRQAIRQSLIPQIQATAVAGLVTIPNIFAGTILGGATPLNAAGYYISITSTIALSQSVVNLILAKFWY
jgi:putative ABC transport system permease protein